MNPQPRLRMMSLPAQPLDEESRRFVPRAGDLLDDKTAREREAELPSTEPDGSGNDQLARIRDSVLSGLRLVEDARQKTPLDARVPEGVESLLAAEKDTRPVKRADPTSDVFAPAGSRDRVLDSEGATPRDRPPKHIGQERATDIHRATTLTMKGRPYAPRSEPTEPLPRHERETDQERAMVASIYNSERAFHDIKNNNPERAAEIVSLAEALKATGRLDDRDLVLAAHAREKVALKKQTLPSMVEGQEDRVIAFALVARELDDRYRDHMKIEQERLVGELEGLPPEKRDTVFADFESFVERDAANDSNFCRREMHKALREEREELHRAYVFALALDRKKPPPLDENVPTIVVDDDDALGGRGRG